MPNSGYIIYTTLEEYFLDNGQATGNTKPNTIGDPDYIAPVYDTDVCNLPSATPSVTPTVTPSISVSISPTPSVSTSTPPSPTPSVTPSVTPSIPVSVSPSVTPSPSLNVSPTPSPSVNAYYYYSADRYECIDGYCTYVETISIANPIELVVDPGKFYHDPVNCYIFSIVDYAGTGPYLITDMSGIPTRNCSELCYGQLCY